MFESINRKQFIALLLLQAAEVDYHFAKEEKEYILTFVSEETMINLLLLSNSHRLACHAFLKENINTFFPTSVEKRELKNILLKLFLSDRSYNQFERTFMEYFREEFIGNAAAANL